MTKYHANQRVYLTKDGKLCAESDPASAFLFATPGQEFPAEKLEQYPNAAEFFDGMAKAEKSASKRVEPATEETPAPEAHSAHGRKAKHR